MKKLMVTAAALMFGTSALAWAPAEEAHLIGTQFSMAKSDWSAAKSPVSSSSFDDKGVMKAEDAGLAASSTWSKGESDMLATALAKADDASAEPMASADMSDVKNAVELASSTVADESDASAGIATASSDSASKDTGMGGPLEEAQGYPACEPGRGDDHCIQLYERGVAQSLAAWKGSEPAVAVGGPFEPSADGAKDQPAPETDHATMDHSTMDHGAMTTDTATADKPAATAETDATAAATAKPAPMESDAADSSAETVTEK